MHGITLFNSLIKSFWNSEFIQDVKGRLFTTFGLAGVGTAPSIEPVKSTVEQITKHQVIETLQIISLVISILVGASVLYKFIKSLKKGKE